MPDAGRAMLLEHPARAASGPLRSVERRPEAPAPGSSCCASLPVASAALIFSCARAIWQMRATPIVPGHQIVGRVEAVGTGVAGWRAGDRAGVAWLAGSDGTCDKCRSGRENLCERATFTGWDVDGGYATHAIARADFALRIPDGYDDLAGGAAAVRRGDRLPVAQAQRRRAGRPARSLRLRGVGPHHVADRAPLGLPHLRRHPFGGRTGTRAVAGGRMGRRLRRPAARAAGRGDHVRAVGRRGPSRASRRRSRRDRGHQCDPPRSPARDALRGALVGTAAGERRELHPGRRPRISRPGGAHPGSDDFRDTSARGCERRAGAAGAPARSGALPFSFPRAGCQGGSGRRSPGRSRSPTKRGRGRWCWSTRSRPCRRSRSRPGRGPSPASRSPGTGCAGSL